MGKRNIKSPCAFLDRDGTIIYDRNYLSDPAQVKLYAFSAQSIKKMRAAGFKVIVITNQSGISRGKFSLKQLDSIHKRFLGLLRQEGAKVDGLYFCPHTDEDDCDCRKPRIGMFLRAAKEHNLDLEKSFMVGDSVRDYLAGIKMGGRGILIRTGHGKSQEKKISDQEKKPTIIVRSLKEAANFIIKSLGRDL